jgi:hypothetical protein
MHAAEDCAADPESLCAFGHRYDLFSQIGSELLIFRPWLGVMDDLCLPTSVHHEPI